jgi:3,4-dihydroxy 2-butanone 4-phosphate synthase / GTP cyclohydrolase II
MISWRIRRQSFVTCLRDEPMTVGGVRGRVRVYETPFDQMQHAVAVFGDVAGAERVPTRIHREQAVPDLFGRRPGAKTWVETAVDALKGEGRGILMLLRQPQVCDFEAEAADAEPGAAPADGERHASAKARRQRWREIGVGAQILRDLQVRSIAVLATRERAYVGLTGFGIEVAGTILLDE